MGLFPIIMNILQFWLIDTIVKAAPESTLVLDSDSAHPSLDDGVREPLFHSPSDDEDDDEDTGPAPRHDIENPRQLRSQSHDEHKHISTPASVNADEPKSTGSSTSQGAIDAEPSVVAHAYPPSIASGSTSPASRRTSLSPPPLHRYQRSSPAPLRLQSAHQPAINSPSPNPKTPRSFQAIPEPIALAAIDPESSKDWESSWDDGDEWTTNDVDDGSGKQERLSDAWASSPPLQMGAIRS